MLADPSSLWTKKEACAELHISQRTFERFVRRTKLKPEPSLGRAFYWDPNKLQTAVERTFGQRIKAVGLK